MSRRMSRRLHWIEPHRRLVHQHHLRRACGKARASSTRRRLPRSRSASGRWPGRQGRSARQGRGDPFPRHAPRQAMEVGMKEEVDADGQLEIERRRLEDDAYIGQRPDGAVAKVVAAHGDLARSRARTVR